MVGYSYVSFKFSDNSTGVVYLLGLNILILTNLLFISLN